MYNSTKEIPFPVLVAGVLGVAALAVSAYAQVRIYSLSHQLALAASTTAQTTANLEQKVVSLSDTLYAAQQGLDAVQARLGGFETTVGDISGTVGTLEKLSQTDPQLLQKYSKVYFLNENYVPKSLMQIPKEWVYSTTKTEQFLADAEPHLIDLLREARNDDVTLYVASAYRSFATQNALKTSYKVTYGSGANAFSADQGYSEHQLGTALDFTTEDLKGAIDGFDKTGQYEWLLKNAYKYGFSLSYPPDNNYYVFEPWHWRFVGVALAQYLHQHDLYFYQMEQRDIDQYLVNIFD